MTIDKENLKKIKNDLLVQKSQILKEGGKTFEDGSLAQDIDDVSDFADLSSAETDRNFLLRLRDRDRKLLTKIDDALQRIDEEDFGICISCGKEINIKRLMARPVVTLCIDCKSRQEQEEKKLGS